MTINGIDYAEQPITESEFRSLFPKNLKGCTQQRGTMSGAAWQEYRFRINGVPVAFALLTSEGIGSMSKLKSVEYFKLMVN